MQLFKAFFKIAWKHLPSISMYFVIYTIITFAIGTQNKQNIDTMFRSKELAVCVIDEDHSTASEALYAHLDTLHKMKDLENDPEVLQDYLYYRFVDYILTIPAGFEENLLNGETEDLLTNVVVPGGTAGHFVNQQIQEYLKSLQVYMVGGFTLEEAIELTNSSLSDASEVQSLTFEEDTLSAQKEIFFYYQYLPYIFIAMLVCGLAPILITFNKKELNARTTCSSLSLTKRTLQLSLASIVYSLVIWVGFQIMALIVYGHELCFSTNALYAMLNSFVFLLVSAAITLLVSTFQLSFSAVNMVSNLVGLGMAFTCGIFVSQDLLSETTLKIAHFLPAYWYIRANDMLSGLSKGTFNLEFYWMAIVIQLLFATAIFAVSLATAKIRRQKAVA